MTDTHRTSGMAITSRPAILLLVASLFVACDLASAAASIQDLMADAKSSVSLGDVTVTEGGSASLPCDMTLPTPDDAIYLVVWFVEPNRKPIYTFDARGKPLAMGRRWSEVASFGLRSDFRFALTNGQVPSQGYLVINRTTLADEGIYRCRVDFKKSPARHYRVFLNVTVPPSEPVITDETGREIRSGRIGPLQENQSLALHCHVTGGKPAPRVEWLINGHHYSSIRVNPAEAESLHVTQQLYGNEIDADSRGANKELLKQLYVSEVRIGSLTRSYQDARVTCRATNTENGPAKARTLTIDIQLPPLKADIIRSETRFVIGETSEIRCQTYGSRPSASVTWWKDNIRLPDSAHKAFDEISGNMTTSILRVNLTKEDHGKMLTCRAFNRLLDASAIEDFLRLDVQFPPTAHLRLGPTLKPETIKEGDDVYFECAISANPDITKLIWKHEDRLLVYNASAGVIMANQSLVLRGLKKQHSGDYRCIGINARGEGVSNPVTLVVRYAPLCRQALRNIRGAERGEIIDLACAVDSLPRPIKFRWALNTTRGWRDIASSPSGTLASSPASIQTVGSLSPGGETLRFRPELEADFGTVACWALSDLGWQQDPCLFRFYPAGPPESMTNCSVLNQTADSIHVSCIASDDGGLKQSFQLQAMDLITGTPQLTLQSESAPEFWLTDLEPGSTFTLYLYAANAKGLSAPVLLQASTLKEAAKRTVPPSTDTFSSSVVGVMASTAGTGLLLIGVIAVVACLRCRKANSGSSNTSLLPASDGTAQADSNAKRCPTNGATLSSAYSNGDATNPSPLQNYEENGGFHLQSAQHAPTSNSHAEKRSCMKISSAFVVDMSDVPESCV